MNRAREVLSMRYSGYDVPDIAHALGITEFQVQKIIDQAIASSSDEFRATYVRESELAKLNEMEEKFLAGANEGQHKDAYLVLKMMERRAAILGIDKAPPVNLQVNLVNILSSLNPHKVIEHVK